MYGVWTSLDEKNSYINRQNIHIYNTDQILKKVSEVTKYDRLPNLDKICFEKVYELDDDFKKQGMEIFNPFGSIARAIREDIMNFSFAASDELNKMADELASSYKEYMVLPKMTTCDLYENLTKNYKELCNKAQNYSIENNLKRVIFEYYKDNRYWIYTPGEFTRTWENQKKELLQLGYEDFIKENEVELLNLIKIQEENSKEFELNEIKNGRRKLTDEEIGIALEKLSMEKKELEATFLEDIDILKKEREVLELQFAEEESIKR